jgi:hypothetical protein
MADPTTTQTQTNWLEYPVQTPTGNYVNARFNPGTGEIQAKLGSDWQTIGQVPQGTSRLGANQLNEPMLDQKYFGSGLGWALPSQQQIWTMKQLAAQQQQQAQTSAGTAPALTAQSYFGPGGINRLGSTAAAQPSAAQMSAGTTTQGNPSMANTIYSSTTGMPQVSPQQAISYYSMMGGNPNIDPQTAMAYFQAANPHFGATGVSAQDAINYYIQKGGNPNIDPATATVFYEAQHPALMAKGIANAAMTPEQRALGQLAQTDPTSEALRQALGQSYLTNLGGGPAAPQFGGIPGSVPQFGGMPKFALDLSRGAAAPAAADVQSYLNLYKQIDPQGYAQRVALAGGMDKFVQQAQAQRALGSQLDPGTIREVEQGTRAAQIARGNVYGTPQLVAETMARGSAGEQRLQQREQMLQSALGQQQSYLGAGLGLGDVANTLYNQGYNRYLQGYGTQANTALQSYGQQLAGWQAQQNARLQSQGAALGYLGSGQTPYQAGTSYLNMAQQNAAQAAQGGPQYNPASLGQQYTGAGTPSFPQYGLDVSQLAGNWYNNINQANLQAYGLQQAYGQRSGGNYGTMGAGIGTGLGAAVGSIIPGVGTAIGGALGGAIGGAAGGAFSR